MSGPEGAAAAGPRAGVVAVSVLVAVALGACGEPVQRSLCDAFDEFVASGEVVDATDPATTSAEEAEDLAFDYLSAVHHLDERAERYHTELDNLESAVEDIVRTLASVRADADQSVWLPLIEDDIASAADVAARVEERIGPSCPV